ncbi:hypothetical protein H0H81_010921 [Sphagnurus paluster]|uniref:DNA polymerase lambda n=1 Tax=Sphagnurus paluster TaxID=117069 RepID=A0A9P7K571_9AGAR|nr:hypothetical protein H0H81_010921 [Sphagnurus paluster]
MDLEAFYREQDKRMNLPEEDLDEYLNRIGAPRRRQEAPTLCALFHEPEPQLQDKRKPRVPQEDIVIVQPGPSEQPNDLSSLVPTASNKANDALKGNLVLEQRASPIDDGISPQAEEIGFPNTVTEPQRSQPTTPHSSAPLATTSFNDAQSETLKRKASAIDPSPPAPHKKRNIASDASKITKTESEIVRTSPDLTHKKNMPTGTEPPKNIPSPRSSSPGPTEDISFSVSPKAPTTEIPPRPIVRKDKEGKKGTRGRNIAPLNLLAIELPARDAPCSTGPPTSPIEDTSMVASSRLQAAPSKLYLEVKQRVAQHASFRKRNNFIKLSENQGKSGDVTDDDDSVICVSSSSSPPRPSSPPRDSSPTLATGPFTKKTSKKLQASMSKVTKEKAKPKLAKAKKEKPGLMTPADYAQVVIDKYREKFAKDPSKALSASNFLTGKVIFYTGGDMQYASERTRGRMDIIVKKGGELLTQYDAARVTHIVTDAQSRATLRALGLKDLKEIPDHVPTVTWGWVASSMGRAPQMMPGGMQVRMDETFMWAAFHERIDEVSKRRRVSNPNAKGKAKAQPVQGDAEFSRISEFTPERPVQRVSSSLTVVSVHDSSEDEDREEAVLAQGNIVDDPPIGAPPSPPSSPIPVLDSKRTSGPSNAPTTSVTEDPLAEFYARARAEHETRWARRGEVGDESEGAVSAPLSDTDSDSEEPQTVQAPKKRGWTCDTKEVQRQTCANQDIIDKLEELKKLHQAKVSDEDRWRVFSYSKCIRALRNYPKRITSFAQARAIRGVGEKTAAKIMEIIETGNLRRIGYEKTQDIEVTQMLQGIYGVGQATAYQWYAAGCRTLADVLSGKGGVNLTPAQEIGVRFYDDINNRMPRDEAREIFELIKPIALKIDPKLFVEIMGSYRRGKDTCGDIDIMITRCPSDGKTHEGVLSQLLKALHEADIITEDLALPEDPDDLEAIYRGLCHIPGRPGARRRRIDFLTVPWQSRGAALLYYTVSGVYWHFLYGLTLTNYKFLRAMILYVSSWPPFRKLRSERADLL